MNPQSLSQTRVQSQFEVCTCMACLFQSRTLYAERACDRPVTCRQLRYLRHIVRLCRVSECKWTFCSVDLESERISRHEKSHFGMEGNYHCNARYCPQAAHSFKRWADLIRHCEGAHCKNPPQFKCHVLGCKYREKAFPRADKLKNHIRNMHTGQAAPGRGPRKLKPKPAAKEIKKSRSQA